MDLKSLRERKAMLMENVGVETVIRSPPFSLSPSKINTATQDSLDTLATFCKVLKPVTLNGCLETSIIAASAEFNHRVFCKQKSPDLIVTQIKALQCKRELLPLLHEEVSMLETSLRDDILETSAKRSKATEQCCSRFEFDEEEFQRAEKSQKNFKTLLANVSEFQKYQSINAALVERLKKLPDTLRPGFDLSKQHLQDVVTEKKAVLDDLKRQILECSSF